MKKIDYFKKELYYIKDQDKRKDAEILINMLPNYFFEIPASSTGKYHPSFACSKHGLVKHTKVAVTIAYEMFKDEILTNKFTEEEKDLIIMALLLHDGVKHGLDKEEYTRFDHPLLISKLIMENQDKISMNTDEVRKLCKMIESHMGPWNTNNYTKVVLPKPENELERFVHMCDYLASRKFLDIKFNGINIKE